jgi:hypothetical protein
MNELAKLVLALAELTAAPRLRQTTAHMAYLTLIAVGACLCAVAAVACALVSLWIYAVPRFGAAGAPLVVACVLLAMALVALGLALYVRKPRQSPPSAGATSALLLAEATRLTKEHEGPMLLAALIAGLAAGVRER